MDGEKRTEGTKPEAVQGEAMTYMIVSNDKHPLQSGDFMTIEGALMGKVFGEIRYIVMATESAGPGRTKLILEKIYERQVDYKSANPQNSDKK